MKGERANQDGVRSLALGEIWMEKERQKGQIATSMLPAAVDYFILQRKDDRPAHRVEAELKSRIYSAKGGSIDVALTPCTRLSSKLQANPFLECSKLSPRSKEPRELKAMSHHAS